MFVRIDKNNLHCKCMICGQESKIELTDTELEKYHEYMSKGGLIQDYFDELEPCEREFIKTGMCANCQRLIFMNFNSKRIERV